jgi:hypothetical protein
VLVLNFNSQLEAHRFRNGFVRSFDLGTSWSAERQPSWIPASILDRPALVGPSPGFVLSPNHALAPSRLL